MYGEILCMQYGVLRLQNITSPCQPSEWIMKDLHSSFYIELLRGGGKEVAMITD